MALSVYVIVIAPWALGAFACCVRSLFSLQLPSTRYTVQFYVLVNESYHDQSSNAELVNSKL